MLGLPGGVARHITEEERPRSSRRPPKPWSSRQFTLDVFDKIVLQNSDYVNLILSDNFTHRTHYMGMVDEQQPGQLL